MKLRTNDNTGPQNKKKMTKKEVIVDNIVKPGLTLVGIGVALVLANRACQSNAENAREAVGELKDMAAGCIEVGEHCGLVDISMDEVEKLRSIREDIVNGKEVGVELALTLITDKNFYLRMEAIGILGDVYSPCLSNDHRKIMIDQLIKVFESDDVSEVRGFAARVLGRIGERMGTHSFARKVHNETIERIETLLLKEFDNQEMEGDIITALGDLGSSNAIDSLMDVLGDSSKDEDIRMEAAVSLGKIGSIKQDEYDALRGKITSALFSIVNDEKENVKLRGVCAEAVGTIQHAIRQCCV